ncbi:MAG TPA: hypothetical protein VGH87_27245, partial [Polyangiaceae bacterium]
ARNRFFAPAVEERTAGREMAARALELAPASADVHVSIALARLQDLQAVEAVPHYIQALRLAPGLLEQHVAFARLLTECGAVEPSLALARAAHEADPTYYEPLDLVARHHALRGRLDLAELALEPGLRVKDAFVAVALVRYSTWYRDRARFEAARALLDDATLDPQPRAVFEIFAGLFEGERVSLERVEALERTGPARRRAFFNQMHMEICGFVSDEEGMMKALEQAVELGFYDAQWLDMCPLLEPLRGTLRFEALHHTVRARAIAILTEVERCLG